MGLSIDTSQMEVVTQFASFLQIMQDPGKYKTLLADTQKVLDDAKKTLGIIQTKEQADAYLKNAQDKVAQWAADDETKTKAAEEELNKKREYLSNVENHLSLLTQQTKDIKRDADAAYAEAEAKKQAADVAKIKAEALLESLIARESDLNSKQETLAEKMERVKKMLGE